MANENQKTVIENSALVEAIAEMRKDFKAETQNKVINTALRGTFLVPAVINKNTQLVADAENHVKFEDKPQAKFLLITHKEKGTFFPVFTDADELAKFKTEQNYQGFAMKFGDIAALTEKTPNVVGFVINPMNQNLPFTKEMLESIKQTLIRVRKEREEAAKANSDGESSAPNITVTTNE
ncbi:SseB family protein [Ruminococcus sp. Marseille-P6503]|uniref:SseB family protein n=1 Tax=Ruminococcus sp. Marseille-P6503 TaxID=2364796 RepID=UPI000F51EC1E|nr:SseB family protein [Ruminococcus sp. Marseille-P6503]